MSKEELWKVYCAKNPRFANSVGHDQGVVNGKALAEMSKEKSPTSKDSFGDLFGGLFR